MERARVMLPAAGGDRGGGRRREKHKHSQRCSAPFAVMLGSWRRPSIAEAERPSGLYGSSGECTRWFLKAKSERTRAGVLPRAVSAARVVRCAGSQGGQLFQAVRSAPKLPSSHTDETPATTHSPPHAAANSILKHACLHRPFPRTYSKSLAYFTFTPTTRVFVSFSARSTLAVFRYVVK